MKALRRPGERDAGIVPDETLGWPCLPSRLTPINPEFGGYPILVLLRLRGHLAFEYDHHGTQTHNANPEQPAGQRHTLSQPHS